MAEWYSVIGVYQACLSIYLLMDTWVSTFWLLWIELLWTWVNRYLVESLCFKGLEVLNHMITVFNFFFFWDRGLLCYPTWPGTCYVVHMHLKLEILLSQPPQSWDCRHIPPRPASVWLLRPFVVFPKQLTHFSSLRQCVRVPAPP
jgi:hypothetical protein